MIGSENRSRKWRIFFLSISLEAGEYYIKGDKKTHPICAQCLHPVLTTGLGHLANSHWAVRDVWPTEEKEKGLLKTV